MVLDDQSLKRNGERISGRSIAYASALVCSVILTGIIALDLGIVGLISYFGILGEPSDSKPFACFVLILALTHPGLLGLAFFKEQLAFLLMIGVCIVDICLGGWIIKQFSVIFLVPLANICASMILLSTMKPEQNPLKSTRGFEVIVKDSEK